MGLEPAWVRSHFQTFGGPMAIKFYMKHHWGGGKTALGFGADQIRNLVSMAIDSAHRVIMGKIASSRFVDCF